ncbi:HAMP domain-containing sensor histidine kinase [Peptoniphilus equinus]|uniref:histidine kinase n=1 Tax=Peptoniphilus equinus TaxID=3016343 RepID=A0ABY7QUE3_9FIRM|nr:HAMP domain-containing sensor histidine kinase [Peptoniphilus equinus]WBW50352.1 HAMP domain-containing sensor histidine kinase [Peptoniphilus equinus]
MNNVKKALYTTQGILTGFSIIAILAVFVALGAAKVNFLNHEQYDSPRGDYRILTQNSLLSDMDDDYASVPNYFKYYIRSYKVTNAPFTEAYKAEYPGEVYLRMNRKGMRFQSFNTEEEALNAAKDMEIVNPEVSTQITEDPIYGTFYLSSDVMHNNVDPQVKAADFKDDSHIVVSGLYENGDIHLSMISMPDKPGMEREKDKFVRSIYEAFRVITPSSGVERMNFTYALDTQDASYYQALSESRVNAVTLPNAVVGLVFGLVLLLIYALATNYKAGKEAGFYRTVSSIPAEVVLVCMGLWFGFAAITWDYFSWNYYNSEIMLPIEAAIALIMFIAVFSAGCAIAYVVHFVKGLYTEGFRAPIVSSSIIVRFVRWLKRRTRHVTGEIIDSSDALMGKLSADAFKKLVLIFGVLLVLGFLASMLFVYPGVNLVVFFLWAGLLFFFFNRVSRYAKDLDTIERYAKIISTGNYNVKIDESEVAFVGLAKNINAITDNMDQAVSKAVQSERMKTELIANVSHDLKTPLTSIINYSELISTETDPEKIKSYGSVVHEKSLRLKVLIEDLFEVSKLSSNNVEVDLQELNFKQLVEQVIGEWEDKLEEKNLTVVFDAAEGNYTLSLDGNKTSRILDNVLSNVYKYTLENTRVYVSLTHKERVDLEVKNISKYPLNISEDELMERFIRGDKSRSTEGSGLGLSIARSLVEAQGGSFAIDIDGDLFKTHLSF